MREDTTARRGPRIGASGTNRGRRRRTMSVDANGRTHRPKGLPKGVAGTFGASAAARGDADLDESPPTGSTGTDPARRPCDWPTNGSAQARTGRRPAAAPSTRSSTGTPAACSSSPTRGASSTRSRSAWTATASISASATTGMSIPADCRTCGAACSTRRGPTGAPPGGAATAGFNLLVQRTSLGWCLVIVVGLSPRPMPRWVFCIRAVSWGCRRSP